jgi:aldehyde:ferredoxin oxidoreductase
MKEVAGTLHKYGTGRGSLAPNVLSGNMPINNFKEGIFPNIGSIDSLAIKNTVRIGMEGCFACPIRCKKIVKLHDPWRVDPIYGGPEYESLAALGSNCGVDDLKAICKANELCNRYSLDVISAGDTIAFAMECYENGILTDVDTNGLRLTFGNAEAMVKMVDLIGNREGLGDILAEGTKRAADRIGKNSDRFAIHVKGLEVPMHEPRLRRGLGLGYAICPIGADHIQNMHDSFLVNKGSRFDKLASLGIIETVPLEDFGVRKVRPLIYYTDWAVARNCLLMCNFLPWNYIQLTDIVRAVTGWNTTLWDLMKIGERITTMARVFNIRENFTKEDDYLPERFFHPKASGALIDTSVDRVEFEKARAIYYDMMGWDENGVPTQSKLGELDIGWITKIIS